MCGIGLIIDSSRERRERVVATMIASQLHRGPDAFGVMEAGICHLAHTRLSILDLSSGAQPMSSEDRRFSITFNGEIYNFKELRSELQQVGWSFRTFSDTEVILKAYIQWGESCLHRIRGMFSFAIWDSSKNELFCARDPFGEKPLYYATYGDDSLVIASEMKAILNSKLFKPILDLTSVDAYLTLGYIPPDRTIYKNVKTLFPGHFFLWAKGKIEISRYWEPKPSPLLMNLVDATENLRTLMMQAVKRQMEADVPVGAFLSGGVDSSTIVALMQQQSSQRIKTFSVGFGRWINELPYARVIAKRYDTEHHEIDLGMPDVAALLDRMSLVYDEPFADTSNIPTFLVSEFARKEVKVILSGDGGDELFGGYAHYSPLLESLTAPSSYLIWMFTRLISRTLNDRFLKLKNYSIACGMATKSSDPWERCFMSGIQISSAKRKELWGELANKVESYEVGSLLKPTEAISGIDRGFYFDLVCYLPGDILVKVDRAAMANSLEVRAPFLDRDLAEFALSLPHLLKVNRLETKVVLKEAFKHLWPDNFHKRKKQGFGAPIQVWMELPGVKSMIERVFSDGSQLRKVLPGIRRTDGEGRDYKTWMLLVLGLWLEKQELGT
jgi:asparagine synthase (glutamine-hydrolysing)